MILHCVWNAAYCPPPIISPNLAASPSTLTVQHPGNTVNANFVFYNFFKNVKKKCLRFFAQYVRAGKKVYNVKIYTDISLESITDGIQ